MQISVTKCRAKPCTNIALLGRRPNNKTTYVFFPPDLPKGEGGKNTSVSGGARLPHTP